MKILDRGLVPMSSTPKIHVAVSPALIDALDGKPLQPLHFQDLGCVDGHSYIPGHESPLLAMLHCYLRMASAAKHNGPQQLSWLTASCLPLPHPLRLELFSVPVELEQLGDVTPRPAGEAAVAHWIMTPRMVQHLSTEECMTCELVITPKKITGIAEDARKRRAEELSADITSLESQQEQLGELLAGRRARLLQLNTVRND